MEQKANSEKSPRRPTNRDVAQEAGVSVATVSAVVNGTRLVRPETTERVERAIERLGYRPNRMARSLSTRRSDLIGLVVPSVLSPIYPLLLKAAEEALHEAGYSVLFANTELSESREVEVLGKLFDFQVDGLLFAPIGARPTGLRRFQASGRPVVLLMTDLASGEPMDVVESGNFEGSAAAVEHLIDQGCEEIAILALPPVTRAERERLDAYRGVLEQRGRRVSDHLVRRGAASESGASKEVGHRETLAMFSGPKPPDGIFVTNHFMALGCLAALEELGLDVPRDVAVVGYDEFPWAEQLTPPLSVVSQPIEQIGREGARILQERLEGSAKIDERRHIRMETELIVRASSQRREPAKTGKAGVS